MRRLGAILGCLGCTVTPLFAVFAVITSDLGDGGIAPSYLAPTATYSTVSQSLKRSSYLSH